MTDREEVLTQDEIDALLHGVEEGDVETTPEGGVATARTEVRDYDLASQDRIVKGRLPTLDMINEKFARHLKTSFYTQLRHPTEVGVGGVQIMKYSEYIQTLYVPSNVNLVKVQPLRGTALLVLDAKLVFKMVEHFFGGDGHSSQMEAREFTPTEHRVIKRIVDAAVVDMEESWHGFIPIDLEVTGHEDNPSLVNALSANDIIIVSSFKVDMASGGGEIHFALPYSMLEPYRSELEAVTHSGDVEVDRKWLPMLESQLLNTNVDITCCVAEAEIRLGDILHWSVGDVVPVDMPDVHLVYACDAPVMQAKLGKSRGSLALEIQDVYRKV